MAQDILKVKHKGETVFSTESVDLAKAIESAMIGFEYTSKVVTLSDVKTKISKMSKFHILKLRITPHEDCFLLWLKEGMEIFTNLDKIK